MGKPWVEAGYDAYCYDIQHVDVEDTGGLIKAYADLSHDSDHWDGIYESFRESDVSLVVGFPPCTDLAISGAKHFDKKREADPMFQTKAVLMAMNCAILADRLGVPYMVENPVSVLSTMWRKPDYIFHPYEYGGYLPEDDVHPLWPDYIMPRDAYPKKTCLWTGGGFIMPEKRPVPVAPGYSVQFYKLGGKSLKTKNIRSATPRGFARAVYYANVRNDHEVPY